MGSSHLRSFCKRNATSGSRPRFRLACSGLQLSPTSLLGAYVVVRLSISGLGFGSDAHLSRWSGHVGIRIAPSAIFFSPCIVSEVVVYTPIQKYFL